MRKINIIILLAAVIGTAWLTTLVDGGLATGWAANAMRNWEEYGFFKLHGEFVCNPGGFAVETNPDIYAGHRAESLVPLFLCLKLMGGSPLAFLFYYAALAAVVALSIWQLLGRTDRAFWLALLVVLAPGYIRWQITLDPNLVAALLGFPFAAAMIRLLSRPKLAVTHWVAVFLLIAIYSSVNWTTIFVHAMLFAALLVLHRVSWRHLLAYAGISAVLAGAVLVTGVASRAGASKTPRGGLAAMLGNYGWGNTGYGLDLTTQTACLRLLAANGLGLLPVLIFLGWQWWRHRRGMSAAGLVFLLPALVAICEIMSLRNYFGHHPWMSVHFILMGIILSATVWKEQAVLPTGTAVTPPAPLALSLGGVVVAFVYGATVLAAGAVHDEQELKLAALVCRHTPRNASIVVSSRADPSLAAVARRLTDGFDRHVVITDDGDLADVPAPQVMLTAVAPPADRLLAQTGNGDAENRVLKKLLGWYSRYIAHRRPGDKLELGEKYYLCSPAK